MVEYLKITVCVTLLLLIIGFIYFYIKRSRCFRKCRRYDRSTESKSRSSSSIFLIWLKMKNCGGRLHFLFILADSLLVKRDTRKTRSDQQEVEWLQLQFHDAEQEMIWRPHELETKMTNPPNKPDNRIFNHTAGSMIGLAIGDALGAHVEFRPHDYLVEHPVTDFEAGGTWGLEKGQVIGFHPNRSFPKDESFFFFFCSSLMTHQWHSV